MPCTFSKCPSPEPGAEGRCLCCGSLLVDEIVRDRYLICEVKSRSKYSTTYLALDVKAGNADRLLKELHRIPQEDKEFSNSIYETAERLFDREARVLFALQHRGIPNLYALFEEDDRRYLVQQFIEGETLLAWLEANRKMSDEAEARRILLELAQILAYLHGRVPPVIHRDIKPQNLMRAADDSRVVLINFAAVSQTMAPRKGTAIGSSGYAPPEQLVGLATPQSDLYAAGSAMLRLLTGLHPSKLYRKEENRFAWEEYANVSPKFAATINRLIERDPVKRTKSAEDLLKELTDF